MEVALTVDAIVIKDNKEILLIQRSLESTAFPGWWALPGGKVEEGELLADALSREVEEETGIIINAIDLFGIYDALGRDPRGRKISIVYFCEPLRRNQIPIAGDDAIDVGWYPIENILQSSLAFDHQEILLDAFEE